VTNSIHHSAVIGANVRLGTNNVIGPGAVLAGNTTLGDDNWIGANVVIGGPPEVRGFPHTADWIDAAEGLGVSIGSRCVIREGSQIHAGWHEQTVLGDDAFIMNQCYIAHDCQLGSFVTTASNVAMGGHVHVGDRANLGLGTVVHQRRTVGAYAMVGMGSVVSRDVPAFVKAYGNPCRIKGTNTVGMERNGFSDEAVAAVVAAVEAGDLSVLADVRELSRFFA
jgi:UDP-N-acetylglucosamine acyltransferase